MTCTNGRMYVHSHTLNMHNCGLEGLLTPPPSFSPLTFLSTQLFVPLLSPHLSSPSATAEPSGAHRQWQHPVAGVFTLLEEAAMRQAGGLTGDDIDRGIGQPLEQHGVSLTFGGCGMSNLVRLHTVHVHPAKPALPSTVRTAGISAYPMRLLPSRLLLHQQLLCVSF